MTGTFIVIEGPDGSGTTRHSSMLANNLRKNGKTVVLSAEPTNSPIGQEIRSILHGDSMPSPDAIQLLFCADRADHCANIIRPALEKGDTVVLDRYVLSTIITCGTRYTSVCRLSTCAWSALVEESKQINLK